MRRELDDLQGDHREGRRGMKTKTVYVVQELGDWGQWNDCQELSERKDAIRWREAVYDNDKKFRIIKRTEEVIE